MSTSSIQGLNAQNIETITTQNDVSIGKEIFQLTEDRILQVIRKHMPIDSLFTPKLKIDLSLFVKDQMLLAKIARFISPLANVDKNTTKEMIKNHFKGSELVKEIYSLFKFDSDKYMDKFYDICLEVLNGNQLTNNRKKAVEGRVFTLKNSLIALFNPKLISDSQKRLGTNRQSLEQIQIEGECFIRESLQLYFNVASTKPYADLSFAEELKSTAEQLLPFVEKITKSYLLENYKKILQKDLLTFRNPSGYNQHGMVAASIMEVCLCALGYNTKLMGRSDLEPKVTLATAHNIVMVIGPDQQKYIVDPCYIQFYKDIYLENQEIPSSRVLILKEEEVGNYIEVNLMAKWKENVAYLADDSDEKMKELISNDQHLVYKIHMVGLPKMMTPIDPEIWVRKSLRRIWDLSTYQPILANLAIQELFFPTNLSLPTYEKIKHMNIIVLTPYLSIGEIYKKLPKGKAESPLIYPWG